MRYHERPMPETDHICVRFAPSPTGYLHLGSARTGLYNYIFARQHAGAFILRIEDTDLSRSTDAAIVQIIASMREMGLHWDEGPGMPGPHGPYRQTERDGIYHEFVEKLVAGGHLYPCFCSAERLDAERAAAQAEGGGWVYPGTCRDLAADEVARRQAAGEPYTLRVRVPEGRTVFHDILRGDVAFENDTLGDFIVVRSDGSITYNLAVVVDDVTMEITHVIRGDDHISNTPKQVVIYHALGAEVPEFLHMPLLFGTDKKKLSKRHGATKLEQLTAEGFLVEVVRNYLCFLSAEFDESMITWSLDDLVADFDVTKLGTSPSIFDPEKLRWMNGRYLRAMTDEWLGGRLVEYLTRVGFYGDPAGVGAGRGPGRAGARPRRGGRRDRARAAHGAGRGAGGAHPRGRAAGAREARGARRLHPHGRVVLPAARALAGGARAAPRHGGSGGDAAGRRRRPPRPARSGTCRPSRRSCASCRRRSRSSPRSSSPLSASV